MGIPLLGIHNKSFEAAKHLYTYCTVEYHSVTLRSQKDNTVTTRLTFDGYPCNGGFLVVRIDGHYGVVVGNAYLKVMGLF